jgi:hypothetical protein
MQFFKMNCMVQDIPQRDTRYLAGKEIQSFYETYCVQKSTPSGPYSITLNLAHTLTSYNHKTNFNISTACITQVVMFFDVL